MSKKVDSKTEVDVSEIAAPAGRESARINLVGWDTVTDKTATAALTGRELDAAVAEAMGWKLVPCVRPEWPDDLDAALVETDKVAGLFTTPDQVIRYEPSDAGFGFISLGVFCPSTNWNQAAEVLEAARAWGGPDNPQPALWTVFISHIGRSTGVVYYDKYPPDIVSKVMWRLTPELICRAFVAAQGDTDG